RLGWNDVGVQDVLAKGILIAKVTLNETFVHHNDWMAVRRILLRQKTTSTKVDAKYREVRRSYYLKIAASAVGRIGRGMILDSHIKRIEAAVRQRKGVSDRRLAHSWDGVDRGPQRAHISVEFLRIGIVAAGRKSRNRQTHSQDICRIETGIDTEQSEKAPDQQPGTTKKNERNGDFPNHQDITQATRRSRRG